MDTVNVYDAKTSLSRLIARAEAGESIIIARHGRPVAQLGPIHDTRAERVPGALFGRIRIGSDFDLTDAQTEEWLAE